MNLQVHITSFAHDPPFSKGYTEILGEDIDEIMALFPLNDGETQADVDARVRKYLAADDLIAACEKVKAWFDAEWLNRDDIFGPIEEALKKAKGETE